MAAAVSPQLVLSTRTAIETALGLIFADKATVAKKKEGLKQLSSFLDSADSCRALDELTLRLGPTDKVTDCTWPGLAFKLSKHLYAELQAAHNKSKPPDALIWQTLDKLLDAAKDTRRSGRAALLVRRAPALFAHARDVLDTTTLAPTSPVGRACAAALRYHLLEVPEYCAAASPAVFQALADLHMDWVEREDALKTAAALEDAHRALDRLRLLLRNHPGDMPDDFLSSTVAFFRGLGPRLADLPRDARLGGDTLAALAALLLRHGLDVAGQLPAVHEALHDVVLRGLGARSNPVFKDAAVLYARAQLRLGGLGADEVEAVRRWAAREMRDNPPKWGDGGGRAHHLARLTPAQHSQLSLMAAAYVHSSGLLEADEPAPADEEEEGNDDEFLPAQPAAKRARAEPLLSALGGDAARRPGVWAPLAARVLLDHGRVVPPETHAAWLQRLAAALPGALPGGAPPEGHSPEDALWALRYAHALALAAPLPTAAAADAWRAVWDAVVARTRAPALPAVELDAALWVLSAVADRALAPLPSGFHELWGVPLLDAPPTPAAVHFAAAALRAGADSAAHAGQWEGRVLTWLSRADAACDPACDVAAAVAAFLRLPSAAAGGGGWGSSDSCAEEDEEEEEEEELPADFSIVRDFRGAAGWAWWDGKFGIECQLARLTRGAMYMRAKAKAVAAAADEERRRAAAAAAPGGKAPAGLQMHEQAAAAMEVALDAALDAQDPPSHPSSQRAGQLAALLAATACALRVAARAAASCRPLSQSVPACWLPGGRVAAKAQAALSRCGPLLAAACPSREGLLPHEHSALRQAMAAVAAYLAAVGPVDGIAAALVGALAELQLTFVDAGALVPGGAAAGAPAGGGAGAPATALFDDDLDVGGAVMVAARAGLPAAAVSSSASLAALCRERCVAVLRALAPALPIAADRAALELLQEVNREGGHAPPPSLHLSLVATLVRCSVAALAQGCHEAGDMAQAALGELGAEQGVLAWDAKKVHPVRLFAMRQALALTRALAAAGGLAARRDVMDEVAGVVEQCMRRCEAAPAGDARVRVALGRAAAELFAADASLFPEEGGVQERAILAVASLVWDPCYLARAEGGRLVQKVLAMFANPALAFGRIKGQLALHSTGTYMEVEGDSMAQHVETAVLALAETAAASSPLELDCLLLLAQEAAAAPPQLALAAAALDWVAAALGYPDRHALAAWHHPALIFAWFSGPREDLRDVGALLSVRALLAPDAGAAADAGAFAAAAAPAAVATLVLLQDGLNLATLAAVLRLTPHALLRANLDAVLAQALPGWHSGAAATKERCEAAVKGGLLLDSFRAAGDDLQAALQGSLVEAIGRALVGAREPPAGGAEQALPFFSPELVVLAVRALPGSSTDSPEARDALLWRHVLQGGQVAALLLRVQEHLGRAAAPPHVADSLAALRAALLLLGARVAAPATLRHVVSILLRLLRAAPVRQVAGAMLRDVAAAALRDPAGAAALGAMLPDVLSSLAEAVGAAGAADVSQLIGLLDTLTVAPPEALRPFLRQVDPLPGDAPALARAAHAVEGHRAGVTAGEQLTLFAGRAAAMPPPLRRRALAALRRSLAEQAESLLGPARRCRPEVAAAAWRLAVLSNDLADPRLAEFAGELLALAGPLDPHAMAFDAAAAAGGELPDAAALAAAAAGGGAGGGARKGRAGRSQSQSQAQEPSPSPAAPRGAGAGPGAGGDAGATWAAALRLLCDYLVDEDTGVVRAAQATLRRLLATLEGQAALSELEPRTRQLVEIFAPVKDAAAPAPAPARPGLADLERPELWRLGGRPYEAWVCELAHAMLQRAGSDMLFHCSRMAHRKPAFAELLLPLAFADLARHAPLSPPPTAAEDDGDGDGDGDGDVPPDASQRLGAVIAAEVLPRGQDHPKTMRLLLRCLNHVRSLQVEAKMAPPKGGRAPAAAGAPLDPRDVARWRRVYWLDLDYLHVAAAAVRSRAYFTALLYVEAWCEGRGGGRLALPDAAAEPRRAEADALLLEVHSRIEEPDGLYAVARSNELLPQLRRSEREGDWATALVTCDIALSLLAEREAGGGQGGGTVGGLSAEAARASLARSLSRLGASALLAGAGRGGGQGAARAAAAGLGQWTPLDPGGGAADGGAGGADADLTAAVAALGAGAAERCGQALASARRGLVAGLATAGVESAGDVNPALVRLQMLQAVAEAWELRWPQLPDLGSVGSPANARAGRPPGAAPALPPALASVAERWRGREAWAGEGGRYALLAPLQDLRRQLLRTLDAPEQEAACLAQAALAARKTGHFGHAAASLCRLRALLDRGAGAAWAAALAAPGAGWRVEEAKLLWAQGQHDSALALARRLLRASPLPAAGPGAGDAAYLHTLAAKWMAATATEADSSILRMMQEATAQPVAAPHPAAARIMFRLGQYADGLYCSLRDRASTVEWATAQAVIASKQREIEALQANVAALRAAGRSAEHSSVKHIQYQITTRSKPLEEDIAEREAQPVREASLRAVALGAYGRCLTAGDEYDLPAVFRIVQMWLSMTDDRDVVDRVVPILRLAPSRKFLPLMYQVASRLSAAAAGPAAASGFQASVFELVVRLGREHPHHSLPQVFALRNGARVQGGAAGGLAHVADADKVLAAQRALDAVAAGSPAARELVRQMGVAIDGYIELAAVKVDKHATSMPFPAGFKRVLTTLDHVPVLSAPLPVSPDCRYDDVPRVASVSATIRFVGGVNRPKLVTLVDSAGGERRQLVKSGSDDLRQDAVMQQFFGLLNAFLRDSRPAAARALRINTYKVVPFSPTAGLLEWVDNTVPLSEYLVGGNVLTRSACGRHLGSAFVAATNAYVEAHRAHPRDLRRLRPAFDRVTALPPVLHHFFLEHFREPGAWFQARTAFARSVAVGSMAGHVIGLGDRHGGNILLDLASAEVVHIDLGIAFEQGRFLPTPELVPFRMTRNVVDGMGVTGVEGVARRCCEHALRVIRANRAPILTVLEVFLHDPLYKWALTATAANRRQLGADGGGGGGEGEAGGGAEEAGAAPAAAAGLAGNADAERTLLRIKQKIEGREGGESGARGVEGQVQFLLAEAQDPDNLCRMYVGWGAYL